MDRKYLEIALAVARKYPADVGVGNWGHGELALQDEFAVCRRVNENPALAEEYG